MIKKYELTSETITTANSSKLFRIKALVDIGDIVKAGRLGGFVQSEENLAQDGNAWVYGNARVYGKARVYGDARVYGNALVYGNARVYGDAQVYGDARVYGNAWVYGNAQVYGDAWVYGNAQVCGKARVYGNAQVYGDAWIKFGQLGVDVLKDFRAYIASSLNVYPIKGGYYLYKRVRKIAEGKYVALYDGKTTYEDGKVTRIDNPNPDIMVSCSSGIHVSTPFYYSEGDTLIAVKVKESDIITCQEGKVRCKAVTTICEIATSGGVKNYAKNT